MSFARTLSSRCSRQLRTSLPSIRSSTLRTGRRGYADSVSDNAKHAAKRAEEVAKKGLSSELPWLISAVAITVPGTYLILSGGEFKNPLAFPLPGTNYHGEHGEHDEEHEEGEEEHEEGGEEEESSTGETHAEDDGEDSVVPKSVQKAVPESVERALPDSVHNTGDSKKGDSKPSSGDSPAQQDEDEDKDEDKSSGDDKKGGRPELGKPGEKEGKSLSDIPDDNKISKDTKGSGKYDETQELGTDDKGNRTLHVPDAKGGAKRRIESGYGNKLGQEGRNVAEGQGDDPAAQSKQQADKTFDSMSSKQAGLSNTDTKHSMKIDELDSSSKKGAGGPDTAKLQGTVDPNQPLR